MKEIEIVQVPYKIISSLEKKRCFSRVSERFRDVEVAGSNPVAPTYIS